MPDNDEQQTGIATDQGTAGDGDQNKDGTPTEGTAQLQDALKGLEQSLKGSLADGLEDIKQTVSTHTTSTQDLPAPTEPAEEITDTDFYNKGAVSSTKKLIEQAITQFKENELKPKDDAKAQQDQIRFKREVATAAASIEKLPNYEELKDKIHKSMAGISNVALLADPQAWEDAYILHHGREQLTVHKNKAQPTIPASDVTRTPHDEGPSEGAIEMGRRMGLTAEQVKSGHKKMMKAKMRVA